MNASRLLKVFQWNIITNIRDIRRNTIGLFIAFIIITFMNCIVLWLNHVITMHAIAQASTLILISTSIAMMNWAAHVAFNMNTKTTFINYAMLPATNGEKFTANFLYQTVVRIASIIVALLLADALQALISFVYAKHAISLSLYVAQSLWHTFSQDPLTFMSIFISLHSIFVFGGTFFRRNQFLLTCIALIVINVVFSITVAWTGFEVFSWLNNNSYDISIDPWFSASTYETIANIVILFIAGGFYYAAYRKFCRLQVINNKFFN